MAETTAKDQSRAEELLQNVRKTLIRMPHLRKVNSLRFGDQMNIEMLSLINELLPELEVLETQCQNDSFSKYQGDAINFKNVTELTVHNFGPGIQPSRVPISFDRLEHLVLDGYSRNSVKWTEFILQNAQLKTLALMPGLCIPNEEIMDENLMKFATMLPKLTKLFVYGDFISSADRLIQFVKQSKSLTKLHLRFLYSDDLLQDSFADTMKSNNWNVCRQRVDDRCNDFIFQRQ